MPRPIYALAAIITLACLTTGCERSPARPNTEKAPVPASADRPDPHALAAAADGDAHEQGPPGHADQDHTDSTEHAHGGAALNLGTRTIGAHTITVVQFGAVAAAAPELAFRIEVAGAQEPNAVRALVRNSNGAESLKTRADKVGEHAYDVHVGELPADLAAGGVLVVEIETASETQSGEFQLSRQ